MSQKHALGVDKSQLVDGLRERLRLDLEAISAGQKEAQAGATHQEAKAEGDKDMRATEVSYLARGLAKRVMELRTAIAQLASFRPRTFSEGSAIGLGALIQLENDDGVRSLYLLSPCGGGASVTINGHKVLVLTTSAPLGRALLGKSLGDEVELATPQGRKNFSVSAMA